MLYGSGTKGGQGRRLRGFHRNSVARREPVVRFGDAEYTHDPWMAFLKVVRNDARRWIGPCRSRLRVERLLAEVRMSIFPNHQKSLRALYQRCCSAERIEELKLGGARGCARDEALPEREDNIFSRRL